MDAPEYSVFSPTNIPEYGEPTPNVEPVLAIAKKLLQEQARNEGAHPLTNGDGSSADPASLGVAVLLASVTGRGKTDGVDYGKAAEAQLDYLYTKVPRTKVLAWNHSQI